MIQRFMGVKSLFGGGELRGQRLDLALLTDTATVKQHSGHTAADADTQAP
jgi:hypothetical protein